MRRRSGKKVKRPNPREQIIAEIAASYDRLKYPLDRQLVLEHISEVWIESAEDIPLRQHSLELIDWIDDNTTQLAVGKIVNLPEEVEEMRSALACLVVLDHESKVREMVRRMMAAVIVWAVNQELGREALVVPMLRHISLARLRGIQNWVG